MHHAILVGYTISHSLAPDILGVYSFLLFLQIFYSRIYEIPLEKLPVQCPLSHPPYTYGYRMQYPDASLCNGESRNSSRRKKEGKKKSKPYGTPLSPCRLPKRRERKDESEPKEPMYHNRGHSIYLPDSVFVTKHPYGKMMS